MGVQQEIARDCQRNRRGRLECLYSSKAARLGTHSRRFLPFIKLPWHAKWRSHKLRVRVGLSSCDQNLPSSQCDAGDGGRIALALHMALSLGEDFERKKLDMELQSTVQGFGLKHSLGSAMQIFEPWHQS